MIHPGPHYYYSIRNFLGLFAVPVDWFVAGCCLPQKGGLKTEAEESIFSLMLYTFDVLCVFSHCQEHGTARLRTRLYFDCILY
jgi:hypothetical protein